MKRFTSLIIAAAIISALLIFSSCGYKYEKFHTDENIIGNVTVSETKLTAYFFLLEDGTALLDLCNSDGKAVQSISFPQSCDYYASLDFDMAFQNAVFQDMNFDGEADLYVPCAAITSNLEGMAWLWDSKEKCFVLSEELSKLYELTVFADEKLITSQDYSDPANILCKEFMWEDGKLIQTGEYTISY